MDILVKSEMDSRPFIYPLMRSLYNFGSILVLTNNRIFRRLIEDETSSGFRNITIVVDDGESADEVCENFGINKDDYDFIIIDNLGSSEVDACFILVGAYSSEVFEYEINMYVDSEDMSCSVIQFGQAGKRPEPAKEAKEETGGKKKEKETPAERKERLQREKEERAAKAAESRAKKAKPERGAVPDDYDPAAKFRELTSTKTKMKSKAVKVPFPTFQDIETMECEHIFPKVDISLAGVIYDTLKDKLSIEKRNFQKEVQKKDESSGHLKQSSRR